MKSERSLRILRSKNPHRKQSNSPTIASSYSEKRIWAKSFKNEPFPKELQTRLIGHKFKFSDFSDEQEDNNGVVVEEEEGEVLQQKKPLPHFKIMSDRGEFASTRYRFRSEMKFESPESRCKSVESLKLPQVMEEKKEEDDQKIGRSKLSQFKDKNEFNQHSNRNSESNPDESEEPNHFNPVPQRIIENQAEQTKSDKVKNDKSILVTQIEKLIVDEIDQKKKSKEETQQQFEEIIEEEKQEEETANVKKLRISLEKLGHQTGYLNKFMDEEFKSSRKSSENESDSQQKPQPKRHQETINENSNDA